MSLRAFMILFAIGAVGLTLLDSIHVHSHTLAYRAPVAFGSAWWVPLLMGGALSLGGLAYVRGWERLGGSRAVPSRSRIAVGALVFATLYGASGLLPGGPWVKLLVIAIGATWVFRHLDGSRVGAFLMLVGATLGPTAEAINPGFRYFDPDFIGIPLWLPALYACATPVLGQLARRVARDA